MPWSAKWQSTSVFLPGKFHGQRRLAGHSPWVAKSWTPLSDCACTHVLLLWEEVGKTVLI